MDGGTTALQHQFVKDATTCMRKSVVLAYEATHSEPPAADVVDGSDLQGHGADPGQNSGQVGVAVLPLEDIVPRPAQQNPLDFAAVCACR